LVEFENAGPAHLTVDMGRLARAKIGLGAYRVVPDDVLELTMPTVLGVVTAESSNIIREREQITLYVCRVSERGTITLPIVGEIEAAQKSLAEIESAIIKAYYPKYAVNRPSVYVRIVEYKTAKVSITGAVKEPGLYELRSDKMSLVALLMEAGGIIDEGAALIRITHPDEAQPDNIDAPGERLEKTLEQIIERKPKESILVMSSAHYPASNEGSRLAGSQIEVQLTFKQLTLSSTTGQLTIIKQDGTPLLTEYLDITSEIEMQALLKRLARKDSRVSAIKVKQRLYALAELLKPGSGIYHSESKTTDENMKPNAELNMAGILFAGGFADENINSNTKLSVSDLRQNSTPEETLYGQLVETYQELLETIDLENGLSHPYREKPEIGKMDLDIPFGRAGSYSSATGKLQGPEPFVLPVKGFNIPFADVALQDGDSVVVERLGQPLVTVIGLVNRPGNFPYPPDVQYNLMQALGLAGGLDLVAEPRYATVYRLKPDGGIVSAIFKIVGGSKLTGALSTLIKPGDIVSVEHTPRTRAKMFLDRVFRINIGTYIRLDDVWDE
jgi:protein involved in polysaccharide export with SLBB domain